ncbi:MAG: hypothetical protein ACP5OG_03605 [Candidatus Nanoarchaeia archaeon]
MSGIVIKSKIRELVKKLDPEGSVNNVAEEVEAEIDKKVEEMLANAIKRARANQRRTLQARDL